MNKNENFRTPKQTKRLGLKRNNSALNDDICSSAKKTGYIAKTTPHLAATTTTTTPIRLPQSDVRVNYRNLESKESSEHKNNEFDTTPKNSNSLELQRQAVSTNCRPYRLSLSKKVREKMTKKRLEFHMANELEKEEAEEEERINENNSSQEQITGDACKGQDEQEIHERNRIACLTEEIPVEGIEIACKDQDINETQDVNTYSEEILENMSRSQLMTEIEILRKDLASRKQRSKKVKNLQEAINIWKTGFSKALKDLQQKIEPRLDMETLLQRLHIPQEMIKYVND